MDISNVWGQISLPDLLALESEVAAAHEKLMEDTRFREWLGLPTVEPNGDIFRILLTAERIRNDSDVCLVVGTDRSCLGSRAAMELLQGQSRNIGKEKGNPQIFYVGNSFSTRHWNELMKLLDGRDFSVIVISGPETALESAIAFRSLRWMLERRYGTDAAKKRICAVTDPEEGTLRQMAEEAGWESFSVSCDVSGELPLLSAAGLLPMAVAGMDIREMLQGAAEAGEVYSLGSFENPVWLYAAVRNLLYRGGKAIELLESFEPDFRTFGRWWQQLFGAVESGDGKGLFPAMAELTADLYSLGQLIQEDRRIFFETILRFAPEENSVAIGGDWKNLDGLNYLEGRSLDFVEESAFQGLVAAHVDCGVPVITVECDALKERTLGELLCFLELSCGISACVLGVNPFGQTGVASYQQNLFRLLGTSDFQ